MPPPRRPTEGSLLAKPNRGNSWHNANSGLMADSNAPLAAPTGRLEDGHVTVKVDGLRAPELSFGFEHRQSRVGVGAAFGSHVLFVLLAIFLLYYAPSPSIGGPVPPASYPKDIVWLNLPGPGGGGGGGGNQMPEPPKKAELPGQEKITVPAVKPPAPSPQKPEEPKDLAMNIPAKTMADAQQMTPGLLEQAMAASMVSQGTGTNGAGSGKNGGIGSGDGNGLGPGTGGGTGGGTYHVGNGVESPQILSQVRPQYTADAMRAKVQGTAWVECIVMPDGSVTDAHIAKSLDSVFGLDQEALRAARQWRFVPGRRFGQPVAVQITIELTFTLR
jgi:protein TonB